ncbi:MAG TPA: hypothetical protein PLZ51_24600, partial [Aggregatilineales bacterium]|nr:hypothetical protein [Aggregatilineales bacterium]
AMTVWVRTGGSIANVRWCIGFNFNSVYPTDDNLASLSTQAVIFRYSTPAGDTGFRPVTSNGSAQTVGTAIGTIAINTAYKLSLWVVNGVAYFAVNDGVPVAIATTMPAPTTNLQWNTRLRTLEAVNKDVLFKQLTLEMN